MAKPRKALRSSDMRLFIRLADHSSIGSSKHLPPLEPACLSHHPTVEARDTTARTSLRLLAVL
ncbi:MAG: hypothetical protein OXH92_17965, partial [Bryobacterales bacterium]|nr:hypothetical protein [Bryobacterales bacterium]